MFSGEGREPVADRPERPPMPGLPRLRGIAMVDKARSDRLKKHMGTFLRQPIPDGEAARKGHEDAGGSLSAKARRCFNCPMIESRPSWKRRSPSA